MSSTYISKYDHFGLPYSMTNSKNQNQGFIYFFDLFWEEINKAAIAF